MLQGEVTRIRDGSTFTLKDGTQIRLANVKVHNPSTVPGLNAANVLMELIAWPYDCSPGWTLIELLQHLLATLLGLHKSFCKGLIRFQQPESVFRDWYGHLRDFNSSYRELPSQE